ncbi:hypothetical protein [Christiangramia aquimixticola]|uniref:hypothetical protein n=1 Tax=Christiangramia aquimixticola TaxID=1697558 RepID=UPI003AA93242
MRKIFLVLSMLIVAACNSSKKATSGSNAYYSMENIAEMSLDQIRKTYPDASFKNGVGIFEEGTVERPYTILYPETPDQLLITWQNEDRIKVYSVKYSEGSKWSSNTGVKIGTSLEELNKLNGKPVSVYGFGWDYSGAVDWNGGKLENNKLGVFLAANADIPDQFYGDSIIEASPEELKALDLKVGSIMILNSK